MERSDYWGALVRGWWLIVIFGLIGLGVGLLSPKHKSQAFWESTSSVGSPPSTTGFSLFGGGISTDQILYFGNSDAVMAEASKLSGLNLPLWAMREEITLLGPPSQNSSSDSGLPGVVDVKVIGATPAATLALNKAYDQAMQDQLTSTAKLSLQAAEIQTETTLASVMSQIATKNYPLGVTPAALQLQVDALESHLATLVVTQPDTGFAILQSPSADTVFKFTTGTAVNNSKLRAVAGLLIGLIVGVLAALALWLLDRRLKTATRARAAFGYPVVAEIRSDASDSTESYRKLWLSVFREPLPLPPMEQDERWYEGEDPVLDSGVGGRSGQPGRP